LSIASSGRATSMSFFPEHRLLILLHLNKLQQYQRQWGQFWLQSHPNQTH
jgi:hypothetical protein